MIHLVTAMAGNIVGFFPAGLRVAGVAWFAPGLNSERAPAQVRVALAVGLAVVVAPVVTTPAMPADPALFITLCLGELAFGIALGFVITALLEALRFGGEVLDLQVGLRDNFTTRPAAPIQGSSAPPIT